MDKPETRHTRIYQTLYRARDAGLLDFQVSSPDGRKRWLITPTNGLGQRRYYTHEVEAMVFGLEVSMPA